MPFPFAAAATAFGLTLDLVDFVFGRVEAADTTNRLMEIDAKLDNLHSSIGKMSEKLSEQILENEVGGVKAVLNQLNRFEQLQTDDPVIRELKRGRLSKPRIWRCRKFSDKRARCSQAPNPSNRLRWRSAP